MEVGSYVESEVTVEREYIADERVPVIGDDDDKHESYVISKCVSNWREYGSICRMVCKILRTLIVDDVDFVQYQSKNSHMRC